ncbi:hypothetical protein HPB52_023279 [Rhipicephalus sanguineus]|uniref:THAP-type domain-containing protein n=1 Tax=Rhipicephalus sanguineus TaxID=34632 RepID=A0A9D4TBV6_RHISA|nr:hypothetical protein HPB52_023279 [Rhipicephalus sanguineus]
MTKARLRHCYAPGCRTGYAGVKAERKLSLFSVPKDESRRKIWERNLHRSDRALEENCAVCELHFEDRYILREYVHIIDGKEVRIARGVPALTPDAVPTALPNAPKYLNTKLPTKRAPRKREAPTVPGPQNSKKACTSTPVDEDFESQGDVQDVSTAISHIRIGEVHASPAGAERLFYFETPAGGAGARRLAVIFCAAGRTREATEGDLGCESTASVARERGKESRGRVLTCGPAARPSRFLEGKQRKDERCELREARPALLTSPRAGPRSLESVKPGEASPDTGPELASGTFPFPDACAPDRK